MGWDQPDAQLDLWYASKNPPTKPKTPATRKGTLMVDFEGSASSNDTKITVSFSVGVSGDLEKFTPEIQSAGSGSGRTTPDGEVGGSHVRNNARGMGVRIDAFVWGRNHFLSWHGC